MTTKDAILRALDEAGPAGLTVVELHGAVQRLCAPRQVRGLVIERTERRLNIAGKTFIERTEDRGSVRVLSRFYDPSHEAAGRRSHAPGPVDP